MNEMTVSSRDVMVDITPDQKELIKRTIAKGATEDELALFMYDCKRRGVHPLDKKLYFTKRKNKDGTYQYTPLVAIDFLRELGHATGECVGVSDPIFSGVPGKPDFSATVTVKRLVKGIVAEFTATARWNEYCPSSGMDFMWQKMKHTLLGKCAEALAWRKGFAGGKLADLHIVEEFDQEREEPMTSSAAMTQDFPPNMPLIGLLKEIKPAEGTKPAIVMIEVDGVGTLGFDLLKGDGECKALLNRMVEFQYGKNGKLRPITSMVLAPTAVQAPLKAVPGPTRTAKPEVLEPEMANEVDVEQQKQSFAAQYQRGLLLEVQEKTSAKGPYHRLKIMNPEEKAIWGSMWHSPGHFGLDSFEELLDQDVFVKYSEGKPDRNGNPFINWEEVIPADVFDQYCTEQVKKVEA